MMAPLLFIKLGGSLITDKTQPEVFKSRTVDRLIREIAIARKKTGANVLLGHGSGSFGHIPAQKYRTREGVRSRADWQGFLEVYRSARRLHQFVMDALHRADLPAISFSPSSGAIADDGQLTEWEIGPMRAALSAGLLPVVQGDVIFDRTRGGTIASTEEVFWFLAPRLGVDQILIAGIEPGVWKDYPQAATIFSEITPGTFDEIRPHLSGSEVIDVTGGMASKVENMVQLVRENPGVQIQIFSGEVPGALRSAMEGGVRGTQIHAN